MVLRPSAQRLLVPQPKEIDWDYSVIGTSKAAAQLPVLALTLQSTHKTSKISIKNKGEVVSGSSLRSCQSSLTAYVSSSGTIEGNLRLVSLKPV